MVVITTKRRYIKCMDLLPFTRLVHDAQQRCTLYSWQQLTQHGTSRGFFIGRTRAKDRNRGGRPRVGVGVRVGFLGRGSKPTVGLLPLPSPPARGSGLGVRAVSSSIAAPTAQRFSANFSSPDSPDIVNIMQPLAARPLPPPLLRTPMAADRLESNDGLLHVTPPSIRCSWQT